MIDRKGVPVNQWGSKAAIVELAWPDSDMDVQIASLEERKRAAEDIEKFLSNTYVMHLGM